MAKKKKRKPPAPRPTPRPKPKPAKRPRSQAALRRYWRDVRALARKTRRDIAQARRTLAAVRRTKSGRIRSRADQAKEASKLTRREQRKTREYLKRLDAKHPGQKRIEPDQPANFAFSSQGSVSPEPVMPAQDMETSMLNLYELVARKAEQGHSIEIVTAWGTFTLDAQDVGTEAAAELAKNAGAALARDCRAAFKLYVDAAPADVFDKYWALKNFFNAQWSDRLKQTAVIYKGPVY